MCPFQKWCLGVWMRWSESVDHFFFFFFAKIFLKAPRSSPAVNVLSISLPEVGCVYIQRENCLPEVFLQAQFSSGGVNLKVTSVLSEKYKTCSCLPSAEWSPPQSLKGYKDWQKDYRPGEINLNLKKDNDKHPKELCAKYSMELMRISRTF